MPLTPPEAAFLGPAMAEYADLEIGPAWAQLGERGIAYTDVVWLLEAYQIADLPRLATVQGPDGRAGEILEFGRRAEPMPVCPWSDAAAARLRNALVEPEVHAFRAAHREGRAE